MEDFYGTSSENQLNTGHIFCGTELQHTKYLLELSRHFTTMSTVELLVAITAVIPVRLQATIFLM
jgi:hypothetical protein